MKKKKFIYLNNGYILIETLLSLFIFLLIISSLIFYSKLIFNDRLNISKNYFLFELEEIFLENFVRDINLRDVILDDIYIKKEKILFRKEGKIIKYEFKNKGLYVSNAKNQKSLEKSKKYGLETKVLDIDFVEFEEKEKILIVRLKKGDKLIERVIAL